MYVVKRQKNKNSLIAKEELKNITGFRMTSNNKSLTIADSKVVNIIVSNKKLAHPLIYKKVIKKYNRLITILTELLISDDDSGDSFREALNQIERFKVEIKSRYREYLKQKELELMSKQLKALQKEATMRLYELNTNYLTRQTGKGK